MGHQSRRHCARVGVRYRDIATAHSDTDYFGSSNMGVDEKTLTNLGRFQHALDFLVNDGDCEKSIIPTDQ